MKKKILLALMLIMLTIIALGTISVSAATSGYYTYSVSNKIVTITDCDTSISGEIVIPDTLGGYPVTYIDDSAFSGCTNLTGVTMPNSIKSIGSDAFYKCSNLVSVTLSKNLNEMGDHAFAYCTKLESIDIPDSVTFIDSYAFYDCRSLSRVKILSSVKRIGSYAFSGNNIKELYIDDINAYLTRSYSGGFIPFFAENIYINGVLLEELVIDDSIMQIPDYAFRECTSLKNVTLSDSVSSVGKNAFYYCTNLEKIDNATNITYIGEYAFASCKKLSEFTMSENLTEIGYAAFNACNLTSVTIPASVVSIGDNAFSSCGNLKSVEIKEGVKTIEKGMFSYCSKLINVSLPSTLETINVEAFRFCSNLTELEIPNNVKTIGEGAFYGSNALSTIYYNGTQNNWDKISISSNNGKLENAIKKFYLYVILIDEEGSEISSKKYDANSLINISDVDNRNEHTIHLYRDAEYVDEYELTTPIDENLTLYLRYIINKYPTKFINYNGGIVWEGLNNYGSVIIPPESPTREKTQQYTYTFAGWEGFEEGITQTNQEMVFTATYTTTINQYTYKFIDENGVVIKEETADYGTTIELPAYTQKANTQKYTYTFLGWDGYTDGMIVTDDVIFTPQYQETINQYTYKFLDEDGSVLKETTVDYGSTIISPEISDKTEYYLFDYWQGYTEGITLTDDITFTAVYKYKDYTITAEGLSSTIAVTYNSEYLIDIQTKDLYHFVGYFTEKDGAGIQITNEKGESLNVYNVVGDLKVYPYFESVYMNKLEMQGTASAMLGDTITQSAIVATDKDAIYLVATIKYPKHLNFKNIRGVDFMEATKDSEKVVGDYKYLDITCVFDYEGNFAEINTNYIPFEIEFDVNTDATLGACEISMENVMLIGDDTYEIADIKNHTITILPKLAESIEIVGKDEIDATVLFGAIVSPDYTTDKSVVWSVDDETVATISQYGTVTPVKNGTVIITATAKDGSEVFATKSVNVIAYAKISSLDFGSGVVLTEFNPDIRKYTVYVKENATSISLTPTFSGGGVLRPNGSGVWVSGRSKDFELNTVETTITLNRENVTDMTNSVYTIEVIKFEGTKTKVSEDKKSFSITPINIENGKTVILALYNGEQFVEMQKEVYAGVDIMFTTTKSYTNAKVMVWENLTNLKPVCNVEIVK